MAEKYYSNDTLMNLFILHGQCGKIVNRLEEIHPDMKQMLKKKKRHFVIISSLKAPKNLQKPITANENNEINFPQWVNFCKILLTKIHKN